MKRQKEFRAKLPCGAHVRATRNRYQWLIEEIYPEISRYHYINVKSIPEMISLLTVMLGASPFSYKKKARKK